MRGLTTKQSITVMLFLCFLVSCQAMPEEVHFPKTYVPTVIKLRDSENTTVDLSTFVSGYYWNTSTGMALDVLTEDDSEEPLRLYWADRAAFYADLGAMTAQDDHSAKEASE